MAMVGKMMKGRSERLIKETMAGCGDKLAKISKGDSRAPVLGAWKVADFTAPKQILEESLLLPPPPPNGE